MINNKKPSKEDMDWYRRLEAAKRQLDFQRQRWKRNLVMLLGSSDEDPLYRGSFAVNLGWAAFQTLVGVCFARIPRTAIRAAGRPELDQAGMDLSTFTEHDFEQMRSRYHTRQAIMDVFWAGYGIVEEQLEQEVEDGEYELYGGEKANVKTPKNQRYVLNRIHPEAYLADPICSKVTMEDAVWAAKEYNITKAELKADPMFDVSDDLIERLPTIAVAPFNSDYVGPMEVKATEEEDDRALVACREIWDRKSKSILYMPKRTNVVIGQRDWPVELRYNGELLFPWSILYFNEHPGRWYPIPELTMIAPQLEQYSLLIRQIIRDAVQKWRKFVVVGGWLEKGHAARIVSGAPNSLIYVKGEKIGDPSKFDIKNLVWPIPEPQVKADTVNVANMVKELVHEILGAGDFASAGFRSTRSATEAAKLADFLNVRMQSRTENIENFYREMTIRHVLYLQETMTEDRVIRLTDEQGFPVWKKFDQENVQGEFDFRVLAGSSQPENTETAKQEAMAFYQQTLPPVTQAGGDIQPLIEWIAQYVRIPRDYIDRMFNGRRQALMQLGQLFYSSHFKQIPPQALNQAIAQALSTGLSPSDQAALQQQMAQMEQQAQSKGSQLAAASQGQGGGQPPAPAQPVSLPGTNPSDQTM